MEIFTNLKNLQGWKFLGQEQRHIWLKEDV
jgi:hypothetical protein